MLDLELLTDLLHHLVIQIGGVIRMIFFEILYRHIISFLMKRQITDRVTLVYDAASTHFREIIDNHKDESMSIKSFWGDWSNDIHAPH